MASKPDEKKKISREEKSLAITSNFYNEEDLIWFNKHYYLFNDGIWREESDENTQAWFISKYINRFREPPKLHQLTEFSKYLSAFTYDDYRKKIKYINENHIQNSINIKDGVLNLETMNVKKYEKEDFCFYKLPFNYIKKPKCPIMWKFLAFSMGFDKDCDKDDFKKTLEFIQEWMGYTLTGGNKLHKSLIMIGEGGNGKSTFINILREIAGKYNCSNVDLSFLNDGSQIFMTKNKLINFASDIGSGQQLDTGIIKKAVVGDIVTANEKFKGQVDMAFIAKLIIDCNDMPYLKNAGNAILRRFHILHWKIIIPEEEQDKELDKKLSAEAEQIFSWAVNGLIRLRTRGNFDPPDRCLYSSQEYIKNNDSIAFWIEENDILDKTSKVKTHEVYQNYCNYCDDSRLKPFGKQKFYTKLAVKGHERKKFGGDWYILGLTMPNQTLL